MINLLVEQLQNPEDKTTQDHIDWLDICWQDEDSRIQRNKIDNALVLMPQFGCWLRKAAMRMNQWVLQNFNISFLGFWNTYAFITCSLKKWLKTNTVKQGWIHGFPSRLRVSNGGDGEGHRGIWAGAVSSNPQRHRKSKMGTDWPTD